MVVFYTNEVRVCNGCKGYSIFMDYCLIISIGFCRNPFQEDNSGLFPPSIEGTNARVLFLFSKRENQTLTQYHDLLTSFTPLPSLPSTPLPLLHKFMSSIWISISQPYSRHTVSPVNNHVYCSCLAGLFPIKLSQCFPVSTAENLRLREELRSLQMERTCKVCIGNQINCVIIPCGHLVVCNECGRLLHKCPICRGLLERTVGVRWS